ncbi:MAG: SDR family NAD(P)-dependent oxidoreductase [Cytophagaceae bacterium]
MKYTLITGASRGIGEAMARYCATKKMNIILVARSGERLENLALELAEQYSVDVKSFVADLTESGKIADLYNWCKALDYEVNILINNAGVGSYGQFENLPMEEQMKLIDLNISATVQLTYQFMPMLKEQTKAHILNVASTACYQAIPYMSVYAATQSFLQSFSLGIRTELKNYNIYASCLCPGPTATDFFDRAGLAGLPVNSKEVKMSPEEVAETAIEGMLDNVAEIVPGTSNALGAYFSKLFPNTWVVKAITSYFRPRTSVA